MHVSSFASACINGLIKLDAMPQFYNATRLFCDRWGIGCCVGIVHREQVSIESTGDDQKPGHEFERFNTPTYNPSKL